MKSYTRAGFLYYQITQINKFPGIIICSDKEIISHSFANEDIRDNYIQDLTQDLSNVGVTLYQIPYTATWVNPAVVLSVRALQSNLIVIEFPWNYELQFKYSSLEQRNTVYNDILSNLKSKPSGDFLTKAEADATYLSINKAEDTYATQQDVTNDLNKKANKDEVVNLIDNQTIAGNKSFTGELSINSDLTYAQLSNASILTKAQVIEAIKMYSPTVHNSVVLTTSVKDDADANYPYLNTFNIEGAKPTYIPTAILSSDQVISGNYSSVTESIEGAITIRTKVELEAGTIIPQVILQPTF